MGRAPLEWWLPAVAAFGVFAWLYFRIRAAGAERVAAGQHRSMWLSLAAALAFLFFHFEIHSRRLPYPWNAILFSVIALVVAVAALRASSQRLVKTFMIANTK